LAAKNAAIMPSLRRFGGLVCFAMPRSHLADLVIIDRIGAQISVLAFAGLSEGLGVRRRGIEEGKSCLDCFHF
jgi:hypothetical protein